LSGNTGGKFAHNVVNETGKLLETVIDVKVMRRHPEIGDIIDNIVQRVLPLWQAVKFIDYKLRQMMDLLSIGATLKLSL
jgi:hypothetical protein